MRAAAFLALWLVALAVWQRLLQSHRSQLIGVALATSLGICGPVLSYLGAEFSAAHDTVDGWNVLGPIPAALRQVQEANSALADWLIPISLLLVGSFIRAVQKSRKLSRASL